MATGATIYNFDIDLADADRSVYESLALRLARHPSESEEYMVTRVLAYALEHAEGIAFSIGGLADPDEPAMTVRDLSGALRVWIEVGTPDAARLHKASKASPRVVVYTHKDAGRLASRLSGERIHRAEALELYSIDPALIGALTSRLDRRMSFALSIAGRELFVSIGAETLTGRVVRRAIA
ncbi:MAG TPA: YaeQ family protein [Verrucomicrobiae bacterium]|nr:YaeQ family protein [Verrucomicrobiae bacterium]